MAVRVTVEAIVNPTEDEVKVTCALRNIFPEGVAQKMQDESGRVRLRLSSTGLTSLATIRSLIKQDKIRSAARSILLRQTKGERIIFWLHKQGAFAGHVSFCEPVGESPHGPVTVMIESDNTASVIDYLAATPNRGGYQRFHET